MIRPGVPAPNLAPLLGRDTLKRRGDVEYRAFATRSLLNRCSSRTMPFEWTVNPYRGCAMGCRYCYATYTHEYLGSNAALDFHASIYVKCDDVQTTARRLRNAVRRGERIALGTATDPYQPGEVEEGVTRGFLEQVAQHRGVRLGIITKGAIILRDLELLRRIHERSALSIHVSLISMDAALLRRLEPWAPSPEVRLEVLRRLAAAGLDVGISVSPVLPALTDREHDLDLLLRRAAEAGVRRISSTLLFLRSPTREKYFRWIEAEFPRYLQAYKQAYAGSAYLSGPYRTRQRAMLERLRVRHGFEREGTDGGAMARLGALPAQLALWETPSGA
jgi:DNA repair photolyase